MNYRVTTFAVSALAISVLSVGFAVQTASANSTTQPAMQGRPGGPGGGGPGGGQATMVAEANFLFVLQGNRLVKVSPDTLKVIKSIDLPRPTPPEGERPPMGQGGFEGGPGGFGGGFPPPSGK